MQSFGIDLEVSRFRVWEWVFFQHHIYIYIYTHTLVGLLQAFTGFL